MKLDGQTVINTFVLLGMIAFPILCGLSAWWSGTNPFEAAVGMMIGEFLVVAFTWRGE